MFHRRYEIIDFLVREGTSLRFIGPAPALGTCSSTTKTNILVWTEKKKTLQYRQELPGFVYSKEFITYALKL